MLQCRFSRLPLDSEWLAMILGYSGSGCPCDPFISSIDPNMTQIAHSSRLPSSAHLEIQPKYWLGGSLVTIGLRSLAYLGYHLLINASLSSAERKSLFGRNGVRGAAIRRQRRREAHVGFRPKKKHNWHRAPYRQVQPKRVVFTIVLIDHEAWACDLDARDINGPAWCIQLYLLWIDGFFARSEPWANRGDEAVPWRSISSHDIALRGKTANGRIPDLPASRQPNCRKLFRLSGLNIEGLISAKELRNSTRRTWKVLHDLQGFQLAPLCDRFARVIPGLDQINRTPVMRQHDATR